jgi:hypothetical protein
VPSFVPEILLPDASDPPESTNPSISGWSPGPGVSQAMTTPPPPRNVTLKLINFATGIWTVTWKDIGPYHANLVTDNPVDHWCISQTPISKVGSESSVIDWAVGVRDRGTVIQTVGSPGRGQTLSYTHPAGLPVEDVYIQVFGENMSGPGRPCQPMRLILSSNDATVPAETIQQALGYQLELGSNGVWHMHFFAQYFPPAIRTNFAGVELYVGNWSAVSLMEAGSLGAWDKVAHLNDFEVILPEDAGLGTGVAHFTNGSKTVTRVSGSNFAAPWAGRKMGVRAAVSATMGRIVDINTVTPTTSLQLVSNWPDATGDYTYTTYNQMSFYFVPVGPTGTRRSDPTASAAIVI